LVDGGDLDRGHLLQIIERDLGLAIGAVAADGDLVSLRLDLRDVGQMIANEEFVVRCDRRAQVFQRRFVIWPAVSKLDQGLFARQRNHFDVAANTSRHAFCQFRCAGSGGKSAVDKLHSSDCEGGAGPGSPEQVASCDHFSLSPETFLQLTRPSPRLRYSYLNMIRRKDKSVK
jgi:hypothetical protein